MRPDAAHVEKRQEGQSCQPHYEAAYEWPSRCLSAIVLTYVLIHTVLSVLDELETIAPVVAVQGNVEQEEVMMQRIHQAIKQ